MIIFNVCTWVSITDCVQAGEEKTEHNITVIE